MTEQKPSSAAILREVLQVRGLPQSDTQIFLEPRHRLGGVFRSTIRVEASFYERSWFGSRKVFREFEEIADRLSNQDSNLHARARFETVVDNRSTYKKIRRVIFEFQTREMPEMALREWQYRALEYSIEGSVYSLDAIDVKSIRPKGKEKAG